MNLEGYYLWPGGGVFEVCEDVAGGLRMLVIGWGAFRKRSWVFWKSREVLAIGCVLGDSGDACYRLGVGSLLWVNMPILRK